MWFLSPQPLPGRYCDLAALPLPPPLFAMPAAVTPPTRSAVRSSVTMRDCIARLSLCGRVLSRLRRPLRPLIRTTRSIRNGPLWLACALAPVAVAETNDVIELGRRHFEHVA